jgi:AcrR family transcriptional regulator
MRIPYGVVRGDDKGLDVQPTGSARGRVKRQSAKPPRARILDAAFKAFMRRGFAATSTLEIATAANVSKRELYAHFGSKEALLGACIQARAERMRQPIRLAAIRDRNSLVRTLIAFGTAILSEASDPAVIGVFRLAITEASRSPSVARLLNQAGRETNHIVLAEFLEQAQSLNLVARGEPRELAARFLALLWGDLLLRLLLRVVKRPAPAEAGRRARRAAEDFLKLHGKP